MQLNSVDVARSLSAGICMYGHLLQRKIHQLLTTERGNAYPLFVGVIAFFASVTMTVPFAGPLVVAVLYKPQKWRPLVFFAALGSALGATVLLILFHHAAWAAVLNWHPHISSGASWVALDQWLARYGILSLFVVMALPVPDSPALFFFAIHEGNPLPVVLATFAGKFLKYAAYAVLVRRFPSAFDLKSVLAGHGTRQHSTGA